jgi:ribonucleoside-diphosphate reductase alpha chain
MMAAAQPFLSGAISKTINMPEESTVDDIIEAYTESWKFGLKAVAIYRDNSKRSQPLSAAGKKEEEKAAAPAKVAVMPAPAALQGSFQAPQPAGPATAVAAIPPPLEADPRQRDLFPGTKRRKLPAERNSITHKFSVGGHEGYITVGMYEDTRPGEIFIKMAKEGSTLSGIMDAFALSVSISLQYGVPLRALVDKFCNSRFEPSGYTGNKDIRYAKSIVDYIGRWLGGKFISADYLDREVAPGVDSVSSARVVDPKLVDNEKTPVDMILSEEKAILKDGRTVTWRTEDAPYCSECGMLMTPNGSCYKCSNCGSTSGCS